MGSATDLHYLGDYPVIAVISDGNADMIFKIGGTTTQPPMPYNTFRFIVGEIVYDIPTSAIVWVTDIDYSGVIGLANHPGAPILSPAGTHYKVEFINT